MFFAVPLIAGGKLTGSAFANESQIEARYILEKANLWRKKSRLNKWQADPRLMAAADSVARRILRSGARNFDKSWMSDALRQTGYNAQSSQILIRVNERSKDSFLQNLRTTIDGKAFLEINEHGKMGYAYYGPEQANQHANLISLRVMITADPTKKVGISWANDLQKHVNKFRKQYGLPKLKINILLSRAAQLHADDMAIRDYVEHINLSGKGPGYRAQRQGYRYQVLLENLAAGQTSPKEVVEAWKKSKDGHREAMLNSKVTEVGFGYRFLPTDGGRVNSYHYWAMSMARPQSLTN